ncbi:MAG: hypothetical protein F2892_03365, partial [Actinobacteria bacterium]|nr:hypothetical protein [Actinomycetota bacterium]
MRVMPYSASSSFTASGAVGRKPGAPSSVAGRPRLAISPRTRGVGSIAPQPGTSQIPQEIGADATRDRKSVIDEFSRSVGTLQRSVPHYPRDCKGHPRVLLADQHSPHHRRKDERMRIAVIGAGRMGAIRVEDLRPIADDIVIANRTPQRAHDLASQFDATAVGLDSILDEEVDGYVLATATDAHAGLLAELIMLGKPILCEKPIALTLADNDAIIGLIATT